MIVITIILLIVLVFLFIQTCEQDENFDIPQNIVNPGDLDFGIEPPGAIADEGSFTDDMSNYLQGHGVI